MISSDHEKRNSKCIILSHVEGMVKALGGPNPNLFRARSRNKLLDGISSESDVMRDIVDVSDENGRQ
jgi:hypothetical protein